MKDQKTKRMIPTAARLNLFGHNPIAPESRNVLTMTFNKRELEQIREKIASAVGKGAISNEQMMRALDYDFSRDALDDLIADTRGLIVSAGFTIPRSPADRSKAEAEFCAFAASESPKNFQAWTVERVANVLARQIAMNQDPQTLLYWAYGHFMAAAQARHARDHKSAVVYMAMGATNLVQANTNLYAAQRRSGGVNKQTQNATAMQKAKAIQESREMWAEREAGKHPKLRTEDQFAMEVARRWPAIASISSIKKRSAEWRKEKKRAPK
jgi:hypothetical protein